MKTNHLHSRTLLFVLLFCAVFALNTGHVQAAPDQEPVSYIERTFSEPSVTEEAKSTSDYTEVTADTAAFEDGQTYVVKGDVTVSERITSEGKVSLILTDGCSLTVEKGISLQQGCILQIFGQTENTGRLTANKNGAAGDASAIGFDRDGFGMLIIHGGTIEAYTTEATYTAAIGFGKNQLRNCDIRILGGNVSANAKKLGVGIRANELIIAGGSVSSYSRTYSALSGVRVMISDGSVSASADSIGPVIDGTAYMGGGTLKLQATAGADCFGTSLDMTGGSIEARKLGTGTMVNNLTMSGGSLTAVSEDLGTVVRNLTLSGGTLNVTSSTNATVLSGDVDIFGGKMILNANGLGPISDATVRRAEGIGIVYGNSADDLWNLVGESSLLIPSGVNYAETVELP